MRLPIPPPEEAKQPLGVGEDPSYDHEADDGRCKASSWFNGHPKLPTHKAPTYEHYFGPGGYNRCIYTTEEHIRHQDEWGHVFVLEPRWRLLSTVKSSGVSHG